MKICIKKLSKAGAFFIVITLSLLPSHVVLSFNPATHIYIADNVFPSCSQKIDFHYGSIAPDIALYVTNPENWPTAFEDTHYTYKDLRPYTNDSAQNAFAMGWLTHNEKWGADYYAHIAYPANPNKGYVIEKAEALLDIPELDPNLNLDFAHYAIEVAIDYLLKNDDPELAEKLLNANSLHSSLDLTLLESVLVTDENRTDLLTLSGAETTFNYLVALYANALSLSNPEDKEALSELGNQLAFLKYGISVATEEVLKIINAAINLCEGDYKDLINTTIEEIKEEMGYPLPRPRMMPWLPLLLEGEED